MQEGGDELRKTSSMFSPLFCRPPSLGIQLPQRTSTLCIRLMRIVEGRRLKERRKIDKRKRVYLTKIVS